jgi:phosphoribosylaminoimidazole carboxylase PurE protein
VSKLPNPAPPVAIVMGSDSDWPVMKAAAETLAGFGVGCDVRVCSAHRTPADAAELAATAAERGVKVIIAAAGMAAHLAGAMAAHSTLPVIGVPLAGGALQGIDALLSTVQMPAGVPVATVGIGAAGNAAILAVQILALCDKSLAAKLADEKRKMAEKVAARNAALAKE